MLLGFRYDDRGNTLAPLLQQLHSTLLLEMALADREVDSGARSLLKLPPAKYELHHLDADLRQLEAEVALDVEDGVALGDRERNRLARYSLHTHR